MKFVVYFAEHSLDAFAPDFELPAIPKYPRNRKWERIGGDLITIDVKKFSSNGAIKFLKVLSKYDYFVFCCRVERHFYHPLEVPTHSFCLVVSELKFYWE